MLSMYHEEGGYCQEVSLIQSRLGFTSHLPDVGHMANTNCNGARKESIWKNRIFRVDLENS